MGKRTATDTALGVLAALIERRTVVQSDLADQLEVKPETVRKHMLELKDHGVPLERQQDGRLVFWSVPASWAPHGIHLETGDAAAIVKQLARLPAGKQRDPLIHKLIKGLADDGELARRLDVVVAGRVDDDGLRWGDVVEESAAREIALEMHYYSTSRGELAWRSVSVQRVAPPHRFVGRCHRDDRIKWFRIDNILDARLKPREDYRAAERDAVDAFIRQSVGGFNDDGPATEHVFEVREPELRWVEKNLPRGDVHTERVGQVLRVTSRSAALPMVARYVVSLGGAAVAVSAALRAAVQDLAGRVIAAHTENSAPD